jgi:TetR/AcrR family transcriptional regulator, fatty acid metabolism regulator protein
MSGRTNDPEKRKGQILTAALALFAEKGFHGASMGDIVAASGVSRGGVYWHFESKEAIVMAVLGEMFARDRQAVAAVVAGEGTAVAKIRAVLAQSVAEATAVPDLLPIVYEFYALATRHPIVHGFWEAQLAHYVALLAGLVAEGVAAGEFGEEVEPTAVAQALIAQFEGQLLLAVLPGQPAELGVRLPRAVDWLLAGLRV